MAGFISFEENTHDQSWSSANWVFRGFLDHVMAFIPTDTEVIHELTVSKHHQIVELSVLAKESPEVCRRIVDAFIHVCAQIADGKCAVSVDGRELDEESQYQYRQAIGELSEVLKKETL